MKHFVLAALACAALFLGACQSTGSNTPAGPVNSVCPMMPSHEVDPAVTQDFMGAKVGFCCEDCVPKWNALTDDAKKAALQKLGVTL